MLGDGQGGRVKDFFTCLKKGYRVHCTEPSFY